jgi:hypothetical protein
MPIDADDLSDRTYKAIFVEADSFHHDLTLQFGLLTDECADEGMFIRKSAELVREMMTYNESEMDDIFFDGPPTRAEFRNALKRILSNTLTLKK